MIIQRRSFLAGLGAAFAAPAIVPFSSLMAVKPTEIIRSTSYLTREQITRDAVRLFSSSNEFLRSIDRQYEDEFGVHGAKIGDTLRIRLPVDYVVTDGPGLSLQPPVAQFRTFIVTADGARSVPEVTAPQVAALGVAAVLAKNPTISRRFWG